MPVSRLAFGLRRDICSHVPDSEEDGEDILLTIIREQVSDSAYKVVRKWHKDFVKRGLTSDNPLNQETDGTDAGQYQSLKNLLA